MSRLAPPPVPGRRVCRAEWLCRLPGLPEARVLRLAPEPAAVPDDAELSGRPSWAHGIRSRGDRGRSMPDADTAGWLTGGPR
jgi:hypothetical protein